MHVIRGRDQIDPTLIDADDLAAIEQQHEPHCVKPGVGTIRVDAKHVEIRPAAADRFGGPTVEENPTASTIRCQRSGENPVGAGIVESAAYKRRPIGAAAPPASGVAYSSRHLREATRITRRTAATVRLIMEVYHSIRGPCNAVRARLRGTTR